MNAISGLFLALVLSVAGNVALGWAYLGQRDTAVEAKVEVKQATGAAVECSKGVDQLTEQATKRHAEAKPKVEAARAVEKINGAEATRILMTPPAVPGDACKSAQADLDDWWTGRAKP